MAALSIPSRPFLKRSIGIFCEELPVEITLFEGLYSPKLCGELRTDLS